MGIDIYNTPLKKKKTFVPLSGNKVGMYVCGVTVYDMCHIGHARSLIVFDVIARFLRKKGYDLTYVRNFTDVDDKIIARANQNKETYKELSDRFIDEFYTDMAILGVKKADVEPRAAEHIPQIIDMVSTLIDKGLAYESEGSVYYSVSRFRGYGKLSGRRIEDMIAGARVDIEKEKHDPLDFALWKASKEGEPWWQSPWSKGRPGWHIECSAMSTHYLGETLDIHGGGKDLIFPHHENEIAQSEGAYGKAFVRNWIHNGFVTISGDKMSKSLNNFLTIRELTKEVHPEVLRLLLLSRHYRSPIDFSKDALHTSRSALIRFYEMMDRVYSSPSNNPKPRLTDEINTLDTAFDSAMCDDFNTARAIAAIHEFTTAINRSLDKTPVITDKDKKALDASIAGITETLGILGQDPAAFLENARHASMDTTGPDPKEIQGLISERDQARKDREFKKADEIRDTLLSRGIVLRDTPEGTTWEKKRG